MTTHPNPTFSPIRLGAPGSLLAALPALLGFHPERSLVLVCLEGQRGTSVGLVARVDLPATADRAGAAAIVEHLATLCATREVPAVVIVVVEDGDTPAVRSRLVRALRGKCEAAGTDVVAAHHLAATAPGAWWSTYGTADAGRLPDPTSSPVAAEHVLRGRVIHGSRAEVDALLAPDGSDRTHQVRQALDEEHARSAGAGADTPSVSAAEQLRTVLAAVARAGDTPDERPEVGEVAALGAALCDVAVRDACFGLAGTEHADASERLWTWLTRALPAPELAEPAALLAQSAYARGDGPVAGVALQVALGADPSHRMAGLLSASLGSGLDPETVREVSDMGHALAAELGVRLPPLDWSRG